MARLLITSLCFLCVASALRIQQPKSKKASIDASILAQIKQQPAEKYAYVTMWIDRASLPAEILNKSHGHAAPRKFLSTEESAMEAKFMTKFESVLKEMDPKRAKQNTVMPEGKEAIWALAENLHAKGAKYPLVVVTNDKNGILAEKDALKAKYPNVEIVNLKELLAPKCMMRSSTITHFQKLNILGMEQYDKLLWIDVDVRLRKNLDYLFKNDVKDTMYFMKDDWKCFGEDVGKEVITPNGLEKLELTNGGFNSGLMLFQPSKKLFDHTMHKTEHMKDCWGDQFIIQNALMKPLEGHSKRMHMKWFDDKTVQYPQCDDKFHADAVHFVKVKAGFETPEAVFASKEKEQQ